VRNGERECGTAYASVGECGTDDSSVGRMGEGGGMARKHARCEPAGTARNEAIAEQSRDAESGRRIVGPTLPNPA